MRTNSILLRYLATLSSTIYDNEDIYCPCPVKIECLSIGINLSSSDSPVQLRSRRMTSPHAMYITLVTSDSEHDASLSSVFVFKFDKRNHSFTWRHECYNCPTWKTISEEIWLRRIRICLYSIRIIILLLPHWIIQAHGKSHYYSMMSANQTC